MSIINISPHSLCCGCTACVAVCPKHCISMVADKHGALQSIVNPDLCIECGKCERVCPAIDPLRDAEKPTTAYAAWSKDADILRGCASAGAATVLSRWMIRQGGVVYGCSADGLNIRHIRIDKEEDLPLLQGSKYVHSDTSSALPQLLADLKNGMRVLWIGTPCQVEAANRLAGKHRGQLLSVDLICHGVPTLKMLRDHAAHVAPKATVRKVKFRQGTEFPFRLVTDKGNYFKPLWEDAYNRAFMKGWSLRQNCHTCEFSGHKRAGDITIGDFWGISPQVQRPEGARGTSVLLPVTEAGKEALLECENFFQLQERPLKEAIAGNPQLNYPFPQSLASSIFMRLYPIIPFDLAVYICCIPSKIRTLLCRLLH